MKELKLQCSRIELLDICSYFNTAFVRVSIVNPERFIGFLRLVHGVLDGTSKVDDKPVETYLV